MTKLRVIKSQQKMRSLLQMTSKRKLRKTNQLFKTMLKLMLKRRRNQSRAAKMLPKRMRNLPKALLLPRGKLQELMSTKQLSEEDSERFGRK